MTTLATTAAPFVVQAALVVVGVIHILPVSGVAGRRRLASLYGISLNDPNLILLMRHRAVLFGLLGSLCFWAALVDASCHRLAFCGGYISVVSFLWMALAPRPGPDNPATMGEKKDDGDPTHRDATGLTDGLKRVVVADWVALAALILGTAASWVDG